MASAAPDRWAGKWRTVAPLGRGIALALVIIVLCIFLYGSMSSGGTGTTHAGMVRIPLATKDRAFQVIPPSRGGATGSVWYGSRGPTLPLELRAAGLVPRLHYRLDLFVDGIVYRVAKLRADSSGDLAFDTTLTALASGPGMGDDPIPRRPLRGTMDIKFWVQRDGSASGGGNGDDNFTYVLLEEAVARFAY
jgi:hypothetical protein